MCRALCVVCNKRCAWRVYGVRVVCVLGGVWALCARLVLSVVLGLCVLNVLCATRVVCCVLWVACCVLRVVCCVCCLCCVWWALCVCYERCVRCVLRVLCVLCAVCGVFAGRRCALCA